MLPRKNAQGYYEIRLESIGGLGANLAGKVLAKALIMKTGYAGISFASYGSEKNGAPVKSFCRLADPGQEIRVMTPILHPHLLAVFHERLAESVPITSGLYPDSIVVVNSALAPSEVRDNLRLHAGRVVVIDALKISMEEEIKLNTIMLGAIAAASGFIDPAQIKDALKEAFAARYAHLVAGNLRAFDRGFNETAAETFVPDGKYPPVAPSPVRSMYGWQNAPAGGIITERSTSLQKNHSISRTGYVPVFNAQKCTNCGLCEGTCPDLCYGWEERNGRGDKMQMFNMGINYRYCKGCLRCVEVCPAGALTAEVERDVDVNALTVNTYQTTKKIG